ncbi:MAG: shikimate kinase [Halanaerobiales bacterium]
MIISLIGFMGTGKSTVGKYLAEKLDYQFIDTDSEIENIAAKDISQIFAESGEEYFRKIESIVLEKLIKQNNNIVLSTGGGIVISANNRKILENKTRAFLLKASPEEIYQRIKDEEHRPLLMVDDPLSGIKEMLNVRSDFYDFFKTKIQTDGKSVEEIVECIMKRLEDE